MRFFLLSLSLLATTATAFQTPRTPVGPAAVQTRTTTRRHLVPLDPHQVVEASNQASSWLADAAAALPVEATGTDAISEVVGAVAQDVETAAEITAEIAKDEGWWAAYLNIFKTALSTVHSVVAPPLQNAGIEQTWGISIAIFTASIRSLLIPLSLQQSKSSEYVKALKPAMGKIKEKFKDNKDAQNRAIAKLYEDADQNPLAGCFVSLAQLPIFLGLYRGIRLLAIDGELDEPFLWIPSLQGPVTADTDYRGLDWLVQGWHTSAATGNLEPSLGWETTLAFMVMPVILVLGQALTMKILTPPVDDESMSAEEKEQTEKSQVILKFLPLLIGFFSLQVPAGLTIYWFTSNAFTLTQSLAVKAYYKANPPEIELPDYWDALEDVGTMTSDQKREAAQAGLAVGPKWEDLVAEAQFHTVVDRAGLRATNPAWERVSSGTAAVPTEFVAWVGDDDSDAPSAATQNQTEAVAATA